MGPSWGGSVRLGAASCRHEDHSPALPCRPRPGRAAAVCRSQRSHRRQRRSERNERSTPPADHQAAQSPPARSEVYGFLPYWLETSTTAGSVRFDLLSTVAFFDIGLHADGSVDRTTAGYLGLTSPSANTIIRAAHAAGVRVDLTLASFGFLQNRAFLRNLTAQRRAISQIVAIMAVRGLDGIAVDLESVYRRDLPDLTRFIDALARAVHARNQSQRILQADGLKIVHGAKR